MRYGDQISAFVLGFLEVLVDREMKRRNGGRWEGKGFCVITKDL